MKRNVKLKNKFAVCVCVCMFECVCVSSCVRVYLNVWVCKLINVNLWNDSPDSDKILDTYCHCGLMCMYQFHFRNQRLYRNRSTKLLVNSDHRLNNCISPFRCFQYGHSHIFHVELKLLYTGSWGLNLYRWGPAKTPKPILNEHSSHFN